MGSIQLTAVIAVLVGAVIVAGLVAFDGRGHVSRTLDDSYRLQREHERLAVEHLDKAKEHLAKASEYGRVIDTYAMVNRPPGKSAPREALRAGRAGAERVREITERRRTRI